MADDMGFMGGYMGEMDGVDPQTAALCEEAANVGEMLESAGEMEGPVKRKRLRYNALLRQNRALKAQLNKLQRMNRLENSAGGAGIRGVISADQGATLAAPAGVITLSSTIQATGNITHVAFVPVFSGAAGGGVVRFASSPTLGGNPLVDVGTSGLSLDAPMTFELPTPVPITSGNTLAGSAIYNGPVGSTGGISILISNKPIRVAGLS